MAQFTRIEVANVMKQTGLVPLFYHENPETAIQILKACYEGGARVLEFTARGEFAHEVFTEMVKFAKKELPEMIIGVGSVTDGAMASFYLQCGANFIVTPVFREDVAQVCNRQKILWLPGCGSLTEIAKAEEMGCEIVKLFPAGIYGHEFVKNIKGPQPWTSIMPTGGIFPTKESIEPWIKAGVICVGIGSQLIHPDLIDQQNFGKLSADVKNVLNIIQNSKENS